jgi:pimeloyl-ACP methyl ester carboxylesterase
MKANKYIIKLLLINFIIAVTVSSCNKDDVPDYEYFVSSDLYGSYSEVYINTMLGYAVQTYPELSDLQPFIADGVNVYKLVYTTEVKGKSIEASGLVSVPETPGEYPVLSFQNGTNTVFDNCPSEDPGDYFYQLVEYIASMGFVVVIPDYPGFGSSSEIPHPYLIAEPTTRSIVDMFRAVNEAGDSKFTGITIKNEYYLLGYSQGGWATMTLHKALELDYPDEFNLAGSVCGAGPYNLYNLFLGMINTATYPMPSYLGYIINAYSAYDQFTNPVSDLLNEPYASSLGSLYNGTLSLDEINDQLTTSMPGLFKQEFISGFASSPAYSTVRDALINNSVDAWNTGKPLFLVHGDADTHVSITTTETIYNALMNAGTSTTTCTKLILSGLDHGDAVIPCMTEGILFLIDLRDQ